MSEMASHESIRFDEYMEGGIPPSLLKGLGYREERLDIDEGSPNEIEGSCDEVAEEDELGKSRSVAKSSLDVMPSRQQFKKHGAGRIAQQTIIKGNIIYKRTESGGMVASLIKSDNSPTVETDASQSTPKQRSRKTTPSAPFELELPYNCPINENNVGNILDESIFVTQGIRRRLLTLKDDLRRQGGGPLVTAQLKPVHMKKRDEIAKQLTVLYVDYQDALSKICNVVESLSEVHVPPRSSLDVQSSVDEGDFVEEPSPDRSKLNQPRPSTKARKKRTRDQRTGGASDDLWMSCEPGSDDELRPRFGLKQKKTKVLG